MRWEEVNHPRQDGFFAVFGGLLITVMERGQTGIKRGFHMCYNSIQSIVSFGKNYIC